MAAAAAGAARRNTVARTRTFVCVLVAHDPAVRLLVVDDARPLQLVLQRMLALLGVTQVDVANDGAEAVRMVATAAGKKRPSTIVLMDWHMPNVNGVDATRQIHAKLGDRAPKIFGVTADIMGSAVASFTEAGAVKVLSKPLHLETFKNAIGGYLPLPGKQRTHGSA